MAARELKTNTAVIVVVGPFFDKTDGVTLETGLTITNEKITLTAETDDGSAPTLILDNITGATSGTSNDLNYITNCDAGLMQIELSAANVNRLGRMRLTITDAANHVPVWEDFQVVSAQYYDAKYGTGNFSADAKMISGDSTAADNLEAACDGNTYNMGGGAVVAASVTTKTGYALAADQAVNCTKFGGTTVTARDIGLSVLVGDKTGFSLSTAGILAIWHQAVADIVTASTIGKLIKDYLDAAISTRSTYAGGAVASVTGGVTVTTNNDKTGYTVSTVSDKSGYSLSTAGILAIWHQAVADIVTASTIGKLIKDYLDAAVSSRATDAKMDTVIQNTQVFYLP